MLKLICKITMQKRQNKKKSTGIDTSNLVDQI